MKEFVCSIDKTIIQCKLDCLKCEYYIKDKRIAERRKKSDFRFFDQREGFERRKIHQKHSNFFRDFIYKEALRLRKDQKSLAIIIVAFNFLNISDYIFTTKALAAGIKEINPIMNSLFTTNPMLALVFKLIAGFVVSYLLWSFRKKRKMLELSLFIFLFYTVLTFYHIFNTFFVYRA